MRSSMLRDLGLETDKIDNQTAVNEKINEIDKDFHLVLIKER